MSKVAISEPVSIWQLGAPLGEGPIWVERDQALWFVDIKSRKIHRLDPATGATRSWDAPGQVGFILPIEGGGFVAGLQTGLARFDERDGSFTAISAPEPDLPTNRLNDATVDPQGRLWFGSMDDGESDLTGAIYRLGSDGTCIKSTDHVAITNGPAVSPDGKTLYHVDTLVGVIHACDIQPDGTLANTREFVRIPNDEGHPDGPTVDSEGCVWVGLYNGWAVRRYSPAGELLEEVKFPVSAITKIAFGGPDGKTVFATTANKHIAPGDLAKQPHAGDLFRFEVSVAGQKNYLVREGV
ncbi:SMP-30/gluconolactonase/LRE family protein [Sphingomonas sp. HF-S4]|uniref:SMP-30/gluconolactonase/LRE family protein n=1 Tax=Sphingomonas agrestis TaxID=3080540 RepID=A0ABU3Y2S3_9SPHN|nr:SMP-30/gluconolactonase/LRE family protein [Sphingomonas sp. HF-S4]MDV3455673.1 SMP-30/gluconolactonase/LRE family protein [Sphingomonas sp. HF-S4]